MSDMVSRSWVRVPQPDGTITLVTMDELGAQAGISGHEVRRRLRQAARAGFMHLTNEDHDGQVHQMFTPSYPDGTNWLGIDEWVTA